MTTSGITQLALVARDVITFAMGKCALLSIGQAPDYNEVAPILLEMNLMLKGWQNNGPHLWRNTDGLTPLVAKAQSYSLVSTNPLRMVECRYRYPDGHELPMKRLSRHQYKDLPLKNSAGFPTQYYFDPQESSQTLFVWPVLGVVTTDQFAYTYQRRFQICASPNDSIDIPEEWLDTVGYCLAERLIPNYGVTGETATRVEGMAQKMHRKAKAFSRPDSVQFLPEYRPRR